MAKVVYLDCTYTFQSQLNTGIQRVVRSIIGKHDLALQSYGFIFQPVVCVLGRYYKVSVEEVLWGQRKNTSEASLVGARRLFSRLQFKIHEVFKGWDWILRIANAMEFLARKLFSSIRFLRLIFVSIKMRKSRVFFEPDSTFILLDAFWTYNVATALSRSKIGAVRVISIIYDLIPIYYPQFVDEINGRNFSKALPMLLPLVDQFVCISESVAKDLRTFISDKGLACPRIGTFRLGGDFGVRSMQSSGGDFGELSELAPLFLGKTSWLVVGTIEPRKNHQFILDAFETLWREGASDQLVILGRVGWMCEDLLSRINEHPLLNKSLFFLNSASDNELQYCYQHAHGLIFASYVEGFGLPIIEAMSMGLRVVCSDISVFREVGGDYPTYFQLDNPKSLIYALKSPKEVLKVDLDWPTWDRSLDDLAKFIQQ